MRSRKAITLLSKYADDGNGIDVERVKAKAVEKGTVTQEQADALTEKGSY